MNYLITLFKNKEKRKIINKFKSIKRALDFFDKLSKSSDEVIFSKKTENGSKCFYELGLLEKKGISSEIVYIKDELGRLIKVTTDSDDYSIIKIINYNIEEEFVDYKTKKKITTPEFEKKYLYKTGVKMLSKLNNKIVFQNESNINLFTFKNVDDADRFIDCLGSYLIKKGRLDCILVKDSSFPQRKYLYDFLIENGFSKSYLQRYSTAHPSKK
jgi:hypothetical protein